MFKDSPCLEKLTNLDAKGAKSKVDSCFCEALWIHFLRVSVNGLDQSFCRLSFIAKMPFIAEFCA